MECGVMLYAVVVTLVSPMTSVRAADVTQVMWRHIYTSDILSSGHVTMVTQVSRPACSFRCLSDPNCHSFAHRDSVSTCWLYPRPMEHAINGPSSPDTRFYWPVSTVCPAPYSLTSGVCYLVGSDKSWNTAKGLCKNAGGHLFIANTPEKLALLRNLSDGTLHAVGGRDQEVEGSWYWQNGDRVIDGWGYGKPGSAGDCLYLNSALMFVDQPCNMANKYVCEIPYQGP